MKLDKTTIRIVRFICLATFLYFHATLISTICGIFFKGVRYDNIFPEYTINEYFIATVALSHLPILVYIYFKYLNPVEHINYELKILAKFIVYRGFFIISLLCIFVVLLSIIQRKYSLMIDYETFGGGLITLGVSLSLLPLTTKLKTEKFNKEYTLKKHLIHFLALLLNITIIFGLVYIHDKLL